MALNNRLWCLASTKNFHFTRGVSSRERCSSFLLSYCFRVFCSNRMLMQKRSMSTNSDDNRNSNSNSNSNSLVPLARTHIASSRAGAPPMIFLHGLLGAGQNWRTIASELSTKHSIVDSYLLDLRNHGASSHSRENSVELMAEDVRHFIETEIKRPTIVLGHSMGAKVAMHLATSKSDLVERLVVVDMAPVKYSDFKEQDDILHAMMTLDLDRVTNLKVADSMLSPLIPDSSVRSFVLTNLKLDPNVGKYRWRLPLNYLRESLPDLRDFELKPPEHTYDKDALFIVGGLAKFVLPHHHSRIKEVFPKAQIEVMQNSGHWPHFDNPKGFLAILQSFLQQPQRQS